METRPKELVAISGKGEDLRRFDAIYFEGLGSGKVD